MLSIEELTENLLNRAQHVNPVDQRLSVTGPKPARVLVDYRSPAINLRFQEEVTVMETKDDGTWMVLSEFYPIKY